MRKPYKKRKKVIDNITVKIPMKVNLDEDIATRLETQGNIVIALQKELQRWWRTQTDKRFILVVSYGNLARGTNNMNYKIELTQLNLSEEEIDRFKEGVERKFLKQ